MKLCPGCKRYYADDTLVFCLEDGVQLDLVADPNATFHLPPARETDPPATLVLPPEHLPPGSGSGTWPVQPGLGQGKPPDATQPAGQGSPLPPTIPAGGYAGHPPAAPMGGPMHSPLNASAPAAPKKSSALIATVVVLAVLVLGLGGVLAYMYSQSGGKTTNGSGGSTTDANANLAKTGAGSANNKSGNANTVGGSGGGSNTGGTGGSDGGGNDATWLQGSWSGSGSQYDGGKWTFTYVNANGSHTVEYPSIRCGGRWEPISIKSNEAVFNEVITHGKNCINGRVVVTPASDGGLDCKWYYVGDIVGASATLKRQ
jgi:hypothetical protein